MFLKFLDKKNKGAILLESLIVLAILGGIFTLALPELKTFKSNQELKNISNEILFLLDKARVESMVAADDSSYGVFFESDKVVFFKGTSYDLNDPLNKIISLPNVLSISNISLTGGAQQIYFDKLTGKPSVSGDITIISGVNTKAISVNDLGVASLYTPNPVYYNLSVSSSNGVVAGSGINCGIDCSESYINNTIVLLTATPSLGYVFSSWSGACTGSSATCYVTINSAKSVTANFSVSVMYNLSTSVTTGGTITSSDGYINCNPTCTVSVLTGTPLSLTATPNSGYAFSGWSGSCSGTNPVCNLTMNGNRTAIAVFTPTTTMYNLTVTFSNGTVSSSPSGIYCGFTCSFSFASGTSITLTPTPNSGYAFSGWSGCDSALPGNQCVVDLNTNRNITASFYLEPEFYTISPSVSDVGGIASPSGAQEVGPGETQNFNLIPDTGYVVDQVVGGTCPFGYWVGNSYTTGTINDNCSVVFNFTLIQYPVNITVKSGDGTISVSPLGVSCNPDCVLKRPYGEELTLTPNPASGYVFFEWQGGCTGSGSCVLSVDGEKVVNAIFAQDINYTLLISKMNPGGRVISDIGSIDCYEGAKVGCEDFYSNNDTVILTATPDSGYAFDSWGDACGGETTNICSVSMTDNKFVEVYFREISFPIVAEVVNSSVVSNLTNHVVSLPLSTQIDDLLIALFSVDGTPTVTWPSGWTQLATDSQGTNTFQVRYKIATGSEGSSMNLVTSVTERSAHQVYRITNFTGIPEIVKAKATSQFPNPSNLTPSWGNFKNLWISALGKENGSNITISSYPVNYSDGITNESYTDGNGTSVSSAVRYLEASSEDPNSFTLSLSDSWVSANIAIQGR